MLPNRKKIIKFLDNVGRPQTRKELAIAFNISDVEIRRALGKRLKLMTQDGELVRNRRGSYGLLKKMDLYKGHVIGHPDGYGFVVPEEGGKDLFLSTKQMRTVLHGDNVVVRLISTDKKGRREGVLVEVLQRANHHIVGKFFRESGISYVVPDNKRISQDILIPSLAKNKVKQGQYVAVEILHQPEKHRQPIGKISNIICDSSDADMAVDIAIRSHELPFKWSDEINKEIVIIGDDRSTTIIDGDSSGSVVYFGSNAGTGALLKDFTIQNGTGRYGPHAASDALCGGGIFLDDGSSPKLKRLIVTNNRAEGRGAGIFKNTGATLLVRNTIINNNHGTDNSQLNGAGIGGDGGGDGSIIYGCTIENNHATSESGGIHLPDHPVIINTIIANNTSNYRSSAIYAWGASISNCTIMSNGDDGNSNNDPALMTLGGQSLIQNTIIWDNYSGGETIYYDNELRVEYSIIEGLNENFVDNSE